MVEFRVLPLQSDMAGFAFTTTVTFVIIIFDMAGYAGAIHLIIERIVTMAVFADQLTVTAFKREFRIAAVIKARVVPGDRIMAVTTFIAASAVVLIVILMAGVAVRRCTQIGGVFMAIQASRINMSPD